MVFDLELDPVFCEEADDIMVVKLRKDTVEETSISWNAC